MTVHSLVLFENGAYSEISKEFDLSVHNSIQSPATHDLVEDHFMTFLYPQDFDKSVVFDYARTHGFHLIEGWELSPEEKDQMAEQPDFADLYFPEGYKTFRIHYWTDKPTHWELNPESDLFVFNSEAIKSMVLYN